MERPLADVTGIILVGGRSTRMGADKALLTVEGRSLVEVMVRVMRTVASRIALVGGPVDRFAHLGLPVVEDLYPGSSLGGLYTGLSVATTPHVFAAACDMPFPNGALMRHLVSLREGYDVVVPRRDGFFEPLFAVYSRGCLPFMKALLDERNYRIYDFYPEVRTRCLEGDELRAMDGDGKAFVNVNTPEEYRRVGGGGGS